tara:strand:- start:7224 stop:7949 length:726 start_codon:yes stop_codon:yes gene_type:complete
MTALLEVQNLHKSYGSLKVTEDISFSINRGEALGVIGPNGAGKSTLFNLIAGGIRPDSGTVLFNGLDVTNFHLHERSIKGIGRSFQIPHPFGGMTVFENLLVGASFSAKLKGQDAEALAIDVLDRTGLLEKANRPSGELTLLERKRLELAKALSTQPALLLLDEIAGGLTEHECHELVELINSLRKEGITLIWIEHIVHALVSVVDRLLVIDFGVKLDEGEPHAVMNNPKVQEIYMGISAE